MNNSLRFLAIAALLIFSFSSCKKEKDKPADNNNTTTNNNPVSSALGGSPNLPSGAKGALYAIKHILVEDGDTEHLGYAYAWFENSVSTKYAGKVSCNTENLWDSVVGYKIPWYMNDDLYYDNDKIDWKVSGSADVAAFNETDSARWPGCSFYLPKVVNLNNSLSLNCSYRNKNDAVFVTIYGPNDQRMTKTLAANTSSVTFTSAELKKVTIAGGGIAVQLMPITYHPASINSKTYYFVKQTALAVYADTE